MVGGKTIAVTEYPVFKLKFSMTPNTYKKVQKAYNMLKTEKLKFGKNDTIEIALNFDIKCALFYTANFLKVLDYADENHIPYNLDCNTKNLKLVMKTVDRIQKQLSKIDTDEIAVRIL